MCFSGYSYSATEDAVLIKNLSDVAACPQGKFCIYTNAGFNLPELGDVLAINGNTQLNITDLINFGFSVGFFVGFSVGFHDGVSAVVNNLGSEGTLIRGGDISGSYRPVSSCEQIRELDATWNDATNSVVARHVTPVTLPLMLPNTIIHINESGQYVTLSIQNLSHDSVTIDVDVTGTPTLFTIGDYTHVMTIPAKQTVNNNIALLGNVVGRGQLTATIKPALGYINQVSNTTSATIVVDEVVVPDFSITQSFKAKWQSWWPEEGWLYTYALQLQSKADTVRYWKFSFSLPQGAHVTQSWLDSQSSWLRPNPEESVNGKDGLQGAFHGDIRGQSCNEDSER